MYAMRLFLPDYRKLKVIYYENYALFRCKIFFSIWLLQKNYWWQDFVIDRRDSVHFHQIPAMKAKIWWRWPDVAGFRIRHRLNFSLFCQNLACWIPTIGYQNSETFDGRFRLPANSNAGGDRFSQTCVQKWIVVFQKLKRLLWSN